MVPGHQNNLAQSQGYMQAGQPSMFYGVPGEAPKYGEPAYMSSPTYG